MESSFGAVGYLKGRDAYNMWTIKSCIISRIASISWENSGRVIDGQLGDVGYFCTEAADNDKCEIRIGPGSGLNPRIVSVQSQNMGESEYIKIVGRY